MGIKDLVQPPFNTSLMGVIRAVADYYAVDCSTPFLYGASGHAFLANIHEVLCPSGPYVWNYERFFELLANLGIRMTDLGFYHPGTPAAERASIEKRMRELLDDGVPCSCLNMENQLITHHDDSVFAMAQPWGPIDDVTPGHLTFGSWEEFGDEYHASFFAFEAVEPADRKSSIGESLRYVIDLYERPTDFTNEPYGAGPKAYDKWVEAVENGHGGEHGAWWNAMVWSECRRMASKYLDEVSVEFPELSKQISAIAGRYGEISDLLASAANKKMEKTEKIEILRKAGTIEAGCIGEVARLASAISG